MESQAVFQHKTIAKFYSIELPPRVLMVTGGSIAFAGYVASAFAPSVVFLYFR